MNIDELWSLANWFDKEIVGRRVPDQYQQLYNTLRANTQPNQPRQAFETIKDQLIASIRSVEVWSLSNEQLAFLQSLRVAQHVGNAGIQEIDDILFKNAIDIATAANKFQEITGELTNAVSKFQQIRTGLQGIVAEAPSKLNVDEVLLRVKFTGDARISNVVELEEWSKNWLTISRGIAMAHDVAPENVRVIAASTGSIIIELGMGLLIAKTASSIILEALKVTDRVLDILKKAQEVRAMHLSNKKIEKDLQAEAETERKEGINQIVTNVTTLVGLKADGEGDKVAALKSAIKTLIDFTTKGGEVDCVMPADEVGTTANTDLVTIRAELRAAFREIRELEDRQRQLEYKPKS
jgi:hypothetical protein